MSPCPAAGADRSAEIPHGCRLGVLGGTFDPVHIGHLIMAEEARAELALDRVLLVPARISPLKQDDGTLFAPEERWQMVLLAIADNPHLAASRVDLDREGPSYTVDTLRELRDLYRPSALYFVLGADSLQSMRAWRQPDEIVRLARLAAIGRPGYALDLAALDRDIPGLAAATEVIDTLRLDISSTDIRGRLRQGRPIRYQVPASVEAYIRRRALAATPPEQRCACPCR